MLEIISLSEQTSSLVLVTQRSLKEYSFMDLVTKAHLGEFKPNPPIILTPLPDTYRGRFRWHLYNGNHRFMVSTLTGVGLNGLIAQSEDEIPKQERLPITIDDRLKVGLCVLLHKLHLQDDRRAKDFTLEFLLRELEAEESLTLRNNPRPLFIASE